MKKYFILLAAFFCLSATTFAQTKEELKAEKEAIKEAEKAVKKARQAYEGSIANPQYGRKETDFTKLAAARDLADATLVNKYSQGNAEAFKTACDIYYLFYQKDETALKAGDQSVLQSYLNNAKKVVSNACKYDELAAQNPKAKQEELKKNHTYYQTMAVNPLLQCLSKAQEIGTKDGATPDELRQAVDLSNLVSYSLDNEKLFADFTNPNLDDWKLYAKVFAAQPLLQLPDVTDEQVEKGFSALFGTKFGENAYLQLAGYFAKKNPAKYQEYLEKGVAAVPENHALATNLFNAYCLNKEFDKANALGETIIEKFPDDAAEMRFRIGVNLFNQQKYQEAYDSFSAAYDLDSSKNDYLKNKAMCAYQLVARAADTKDKAATKPLFDNAIAALEAYQSVAPEDSATWGNLLYVLYTNTQSPKAAQYKKYNK